MESREIIMKHYISSPYKKSLGKTNESYQKISTKSDSCIDHLDIFIKLEKDRIVDASFSGEACAIATSSCSILLENCINKKISEVKKFIENFENMINEKNYNEEELHEAVVFKDIVKQGNRKSCAYLPYKALKKIIDKEL